VLLVLIAAGCQQSLPSAGIDVREVAPVQGTVTIGGRPPAGAFVSFRPVGGAAPYNARATVGKDGSYQLTTYRQQDGAPPGEYRVTVYWPAERPKRKDGEDDDAGADVPDRLGGRYSNPETTPLKATVKAGETNTIDFKLP
jgi:hypothetical protein